MVNLNTLSGVTTVVAPAAYFSGSTVVFDDGVAYDTSCCGDWALYYLNAKGGWDSFLIEGKVKRIDNYTRYEYGRGNGAPLDFSRTQYKVESEPTYEMHTGWLSDAQSAVLAKNLLPSVKVYAHNLTDGSIFPVVITDNSAEWKTYKNEKKLVSYTINVAASNKEYRL